MERADILHEAGNAGVQEVQLERQWAHGRV